jgi:acetate kinase
MGFTPLDGVVMGTRSGSIDPAVVTYLMNEEKLDTKGIDNVLNKKSGVFGVSGISSDFRDLLKGADEGNERAQIALDMFNYSVKKLIGAYAAAMGGVDVVVFTAGVGENTDTSREAICEGLGFMGIEIDKEANKSRGLKDITKPGARVKTFVIPTNEELMIAIDTKRLVVG